MKQEWDFPVALQDVPNSQGYRLIRTDTGEKLSFVTKSYEIVTHRQVQEYFEKQLKESGLIVQRKSINMFGHSSSSMAVSYTFKGTTQMVKDKYATIVRVTNSYDKMSRITLALGLERFGCLNQVYGAKGTEFFMRQRHMGDVYNNLHSFLDKRKALMTEIDDKFARMLKRKPIGERVVVTNTEYEEEMPEMFEKYYDSLGKNMYGEFQAYTDFISNHTEGNKRMRYNELILPAFTKQLN